MICISTTPIELFFAGSARGLGKSGAHAARTNKTRGGIMGKKKRSQEKEEMPHLGDAWFLA